MEIHEDSSWETMSKKLKISQRDESHLQGSADCLTAVSCVQLPKQVVEMRLDGWRPKAELLRKAFGRDSLRDATQDLHLSGRQRDGTSARRQRCLFGHSAEYLWDHLSRNWTLAPDGRPERTLQLRRPSILEDVTGAASPHHA